VATVLAGLGWTGAARADIYGFIDEKGVINFATRQLDERYTLFSRTGEHESDVVIARPALPSGIVERPLDAPSLRPAPVAPVPQVTAARTRFLERVAEHPNVLRYGPLIEEVAKVTGVDQHLIRSVIAVESGYNPVAVSPKGAVGLMQIMPDTGARYGVRAQDGRSISDRLTEPLLNLRIGARYLADLTKMFDNNLTLVLAAYNAGENAVKRFRNAVPPYPETQNYVRLVREFHDFFKPSARSSTDTVVRTTLDAPATAAASAASRAPATPEMRARRNMPDPARLATLGIVTPPGFIHSVPALANPASSALTIDNDRQAAPGTSVQIVTTHSVSVSPAPSAPPASSTPAQEGTRWITEVGPPR